jgi:hypothetical protein
LSDILNKAFGIVQLIAIMKEAHIPLFRRRGVARPNSRRAIMEKRQLGSTAQAVALAVIEKTSSTVKDRIGRAA